MPISEVFAINGRFCFLRFVVFLLNLSCLGLTLGFLDPGSGSRVFDLWRGKDQREVWSRTAQVPFHVDGLF